LIKFLLLVGRCRRTRIESEPLKVVDPREGGQFSSVDKGSVIQAAATGVLSAQSRCLQSSLETASEMVICLTDIDRGLQPLADLACHVCVMNTGVMQAVDLL